MNFLLYYQPVQNYVSIKSGCSDYARHHGTCDSHSQNIAGNFYIMSYCMMSHIRIDWSVVLHLLTCCHGKTMLNNQKYSAKYSTYSGLANNSSFPNENSVQIWYNIRNEQN